MKWKLTENIDFLIIQLDLSEDFHIKILRENSEKVI